MISAFGLMYVLEFQKASVFYVISIFRNWNLRKLEIKFIFGLIF